MMIGVGFGAHRGRDGDGLGQSGSGRGQSESIGVLLLAVLVIVLGAAIAQFVFGLDIIQGRERAVSPQVSFETTVQPDGDLVIEHQSGSTVRTSELTVVGSESGTLRDSGSLESALGAEWTAGESITIADTDVALRSGETVRIIWESATTDDSSIVLRYRYRP